MTATASQSQTLMATDDLFNAFSSRCGTCHVKASQGGFHVSPVTFSQDMLPEQANVLALIASNDPTKVMPPGTPPASTRDPKTDPFLQLGALLATWYAQGRPANVFVPPQSAAGDAGAGGADTYRLTPAVGKALTNIGNCIPSPEAIGVVPDKLDDFFATATALPAELYQTDLTTFDSAVLAEHGVVAFAPAYPLWADDARKIRYVRVPRGQSIQFDKATQQFVIPDHTRFYKTFLKKVIEKDGTEHYRKMETRLIVASQSNPLFGTYRWDPNSEDTEAEAKLVTEPLNDLQPFKDTLLQYVTDDAKNAAILAARATANDSSDPTDALIQAGALRHYAIPGSDRCVECHEGSSSRSFILGFTPVQINRRAQGTGGTQDSDAPGLDELNQLQRLIDYGVITGIKDLSDVLPLENSQGSRTPRNDYELAAQGYMLGNCAHCHNPNGYPSIENPVLASGPGMLDFLPGPADGQGIFQFPLEKFSPRINRDVGGSVSIPYITPSLVDYPGIASFNHTVRHDTTSTSPDLATSMVLAPWRSLIYRNVDTPFPYADDLALFPHMPMNTPGFDCRLPRIMGDWMVSIPAVRKHPEIDETLVQAVAAAQLPPTYTVLGHDNTGTDQEFQPYTEVPAPDPTKPDLAKQQADYAAATTAAAARLATYHVAGAQGLSHTKDDWSRYNHCLDTTDIIDPTVTGADQAHLVPSDLRIYLADGVTYNVPVDYQPFPNSSGLYDEDLRHVPTTATVIWPDEGVPDRPHFVITDTTDPPPPWIPRRDDWQAVLQKHQYAKLAPNATPDQIAADAQTQAVVEMLNPSSGGAGVTLTPEVTSYATQEIPFGLWKKNADCGPDPGPGATKFASQHPVSYFVAAPPKWMAVVAAQPNPPLPSDPVYSELPGAAVFNMVCINCHGPQADSHGRQADTLQLMTGGDARVANLRDGLFGPVGAPGTNRKRVYDITPSGGPTYDDWGARYVAWMALGGTQKLIPQAILSVVASTPILGVPRDLVIDSANMLGPVQKLCGEFFGMSQWSQGTGFGANQIVSQYGPPGVGWDNWLWNSVIGFSDGRLMSQNGDAELWARLCTLDNPMPVAKISVSGDELKSVFKPNGSAVTYYDALSYPPGAVIGNSDGGVDTGVQPTNEMPWCIEQPSDSAEAAYLAYYTTSDGKPLPVCPPDLDSQVPLTYDQITQWTYRGAINAGLSVFLYLDKIARGYTPIPPYDQCESLP